MGGTNVECYGGNILHCMKRHEGKPRMYQWRLLIDRGLWQQTNWRKNGNEKNVVCNHVKVFLIIFRDLLLDQLHFSSEPWLVITICNFRRNGSYFVHVLGVYFPYVLYKNMQRSILFEGLCCSSFFLSFFLSLFLSFFLFFFICFPVSQGLNLVSLWKQV